MIIRSVEAFFLALLGIAVLTCVHVSVSRMHCGRE